MLLPRAASLGPLGRIFYSQWGPGPPGPLLFSVFCFSKRPPARHPEAARPPTDPEIKNARPGAQAPQGGPAHSAPAPVLAPYCV